MSSTDKCPSQVSRAQGNILRLLGHSLQSCSPKNPDFSSCTWMQRNKSKKHLSGWSSRAGSSPKSNQWESEKAESCWLVTKIRVQYDYSRRFVNRLNLAQENINRGWTVKMNQTNLYIILYVSHCTLLHWTASSVRKCLCVHVNLLRVWPVSRGDVQQLMLC